MTKRNWQVVQVDDATVERVARALMNSQLERHGVGWPPNCDSLITACESRCPRRPNRTHRENFFGTTLAEPNPMSDWHVYPLNDLIEHDADGGDCPCGPRTEPVKQDDGSIGWIQVHHSLDGREVPAAVSPAADA